MADKNGDLRLRRNARFSDTPLTGMSTCPFKQPTVAIVPMRYALDRSRYDVDPGQLRPLSAEGRWARLPRLKTRTYTLRQLRDGFVYVFDETAQTLHEYRYSAHDAHLVRIVWGDAEIGQDQRTTTGDSRTHLLYPRNNRLHIAFSPLQWTWRVCEHLRSHTGSRSLWMQPLDLKEYCRSMSVPHVLPLMDLDKNTVADVDVWPVNHDGRFADSAYPPTVADGPAPHLVPLAADVVWTGSVDDKFSALMIALDDPLAVMEDFGMQLSADQAVLQEWQDKHEHKLSMAGLVEQLCGVGGDQALFPASALKDESATRDYIVIVEKYFNELKIEADAADPQSGLILGLIDLPSTETKQEIVRKYGSAPSPALHENWKKRASWRRQADLEAARRFVDTQQQQSQRLREQVRDTQHDLRAWAEHIGTEPLKLFIDTSNPKTLLYLQTLIAELLEILGQDLFVSTWLMEEDLKAKSLFGVARFGFSTELKKAFDDQAKALVQDHNDFNTLIGRTAELYGLLGHDEISSKPWMQALSEPVQRTFKALGELVKGAGKDVLEKTLLALLAVDSRLAHGKKPNMGSMLRNLAIGHYLISHPERLQIDPDFDRHYTQWKDDLRTLKNNYQHNVNQWFYNRHNYDARRLGRHLAELGEGIKQHMLRLPILFDYQSSRYVRVIQDAIVKSAVKGLARNKWPAQIRAWSEKHGLNAGAITYGVLLANLINTAMVYDDLTRDGEIDQQDWMKLTSASAYTGSALMGLFVETKWASIKGLSITIGNESVSIIQKAASFWDKATDHTMSWGKQLRQFSVRLVGLGGFALIATTLEYWDISDERANSNSSLERKLLLVKMGAVSVMGAIGFLQVVAGGLALAGNPSLIAYAMHPLTATAALVAGLIYLAATYTLNYLKRDAIGQWLSKCSWSRYPDERLPDTASGHAEENRAFLEIQLSPTLYIKPTYETKERYVHPRGYEKIPVRNGAWLQLHIPAELRGSLLEVNLTASHRPFYVLPVEKLDQPLQDHFIEYGSVENSDALGKVPDQPWRKRADESSYPMPPSGESTLWQTWVPLADDAKYLELQVWYAPEVLASGEGDRGYRFQLELEKEGVTDEKDARISSLDTSTLQVQLLGGRDEAVTLPVPL